MISWSLSISELDQLDIFLEICLIGAHGRDAVVELLAFPHQLLRFLRVVPQRGIFGLVIEPVQAPYSLIPVKDASSAGLRPA
jgi:hypothetical protein